MLVLLFLGFGAGLYLLFTIRFAAGDVFPPYSSLRSDPLGTKAFYLALERLEGTRVQRSYRELARLRGGSGRCIFLAGVEPGFLSTPGQEGARAVEELARAGDRVVLAFRPVRADGGCGCPDTKKEGKKPAPPAGEKKPTGGEKEKAPPPAEKPERAATAAERWGIDPAFPAAAPSEGGVTGKGTLVRDDSTLPPLLPVHTTLSFTVANPEWAMVYAVDGRPVVLERRMGRGSIVLVADSYPLSNEALRDGRQSALLAWLTGGCRDIVFDEAHLGVSERPGVMTLVRKYRLGPFLAALFLVALLFVWKSAVPLVPFRGDTGEESAGGGERSHFAGLVNLLQRSVPADRLLGVCFQEWHRVFARHYRGRPEALERMRRVLAEEERGPAGARRPLEGYRKIAAIIAERKRP